MNTGQAEKLSEDALNRLMAGVEARQSEKAKDQHLSEAVFSPALEGQTHLA